MLSSSVSGYSTLEPCAFHGRTPACAHAIVARKIARVVIAMRDPHPRVDGAGVRILREGGVEVIEAVLEDEVRRQLAPWILAQHPHEPRAWSEASGLSGDALEAAWQARYGVPR